MKNKHPNYIIYLTEETIKLLQVNITVTEGVKFEQPDYLKLQINVTSSSKNK